ncbi:hypothetical protein KHQ81_04630 [Mycoplasmatota bacterium]|nr:hypothetical protein KHQ81_04630 [Mycoplasmatota bacterium]
MHELSPLSSVTTKSSFFGVIESSKYLKEKLRQDEEKYVILKKVSEKNAIDVSVDGRISHFNISNNGKYLAVAMTNIVKIYDYETLGFIDEIKNKCCCYVSFSPDDSLILIGTWNHGFIYPFNIK